MTVNLKKLILNSNLYDLFSSRLLAKTSKRLDICSAQFSQNYHLTSHPSLEGKTCLEIGSGRVLSHSLVCHLLGAKKVISVDLNRIARPSNLSISINNSVLSIIRDQLSCLQKHEKIRERLDNLVSIKNYSFETLQSLGIEYKAPFDLLKNELGTKVDFIYSNSVLEHVPAKDAPLVMEKLKNLLTNDGFMIHCVHLEDHKARRQTPFDFYSISSTNFSKQDENNRGNRLRKNQWISILKSLKIKYKIFYNWKRRADCIPTQVDASINYKDEDDLLTSHIGIYIQQ